MSHDVTTSSGSATAAGSPETALRLLGLDEVAAGIYHLLLDTPLLDNEAIAGRLALPRSSVEQALDQLSRSCLIRPSQTAPDNWRATSPEVALPTLVEGLEAELHARQAHLADLRGEVAGLVAYYRCRQAELHGAQLEQLEGHDTVVSRIEELGRSAEREIAVIMPGRPSLLGLEESRRADGQVLDRGVRLRTLHLSAHVEDAQFREHLVEFQRMGGEARSLPTLPVRMNIYDRRLAVVAIDAEQPSMGAVVIQAPGVITALVALFDLCWDEAQPVEAKSVEDGDELSPSERQVLRLLARGMKDESVARQLGVSVRTTRRLIAQLSSRVEADSRFELALRARELGWV